MLLHRRSDVFPEELAHSDAATCPLHGSPHDSNTLVTHAGTSASRGIISRTEKAPRQTGCDRPGSQQGKGRSDHRHQFEPRGTGGIGTIVYDAGYYSEENITAPGADRLIAAGKRHAMNRDARDHPAEGPPPGGATPARASEWRLRTPEGRALYKRRAPDVEGLHASLEDRTGLRSFSLRGLAAVTGEFLLAGLSHNLRLLYQVS
jgi:hypothetical protein